MNPEFHKIQWLVLNSGHDVIWYHGHTDNICVGCDVTDD